MKVYINPGHDTKYDSGAINAHTGLRECDIAAEVGAAVQHYLDLAGCETRLLQSDNLYYDSYYPDRPTPVCTDANEWGADVFIALHCNASANGNARGTETYIYGPGGNSEILATCIQDQIVDSLGTIDRGVRAWPGLIVLHNTVMPAVLVELEFIDNDDAATLLTNKTDDFARAIARGVTDYQLRINED